ncbi:hypothetical protein LIA77_11376 [Sarocladium implicatum]|nr:hypothetical protein LIA77_11376 [Sarocladium implicatum]
MNHCFTRLDPRPWSLSGLECTEDGKAACTHAEHDCMAKASHWGTKIIGELLRHVICTVHLAKAVFLLVAYNTCSETPVALMAVIVTILGQCLYVGHGGRFRVHIDSHLSRTRRLRGTSAAGQSWSR